MSRRKKTELIESDQNPFALSTGDMMSGLMFIFVLLLAALMLQIQRQSDESNRIRDSREKLIQEYKHIKREIYIDLIEEFGKDTARWNAVIDTSNLSIRFQKPEDLFKVGKADIQPGFRNILDEFFPRYLNLLVRKEYKKNIEEIRIEGHTDTIDTYEYNMGLSQERSITVLKYCHGMIKVDSLKKWMESKIIASGLSFSHPIFKENQENIDLERSRRVEFRIRTNAESKMEEILTILQSKE